MRARAPRQRACELVRTPVDGDVKVDGRATKQLVAQRAADQPRIRGESAQLGERALSRHIASPSRWWTRGTRREMRHSTS